MILTTGTIEHKEIAKYLGIINVTHVIGLSLMKDFFASIVDVTGGRVKGYENEINRGIEEIMNLLASEAQGLQADAVISIKMVFSVFSPSQKGTVLSITGYGTAVKLKNTVRDMQMNYNKEKNGIEEENRLSRFTGGAGFEWKK